MHMDEAKATFGRRRADARVRRDDGCVSIGRMIKSLDFVGIPATDAERSRAFYVDTLGLRADDKARFEFWVGETCFGIWEPARLGQEFTPQKNAHPALHVDDVAETRRELEAKGVEFNGEIFDTGVCHMAFFTDPDGNDLMLHHRYAPRT
jgi:catechol 2,3-dioxygenase-like lactoylglutathione lyase family enzyme